MGQTTAQALLLAAVLAFFAPALQEGLRSVLRRRPAWIWIAPPLLTTVFCAAALIPAVLSVPLLLLILIYTSVPVLCAFLQGPGGSRPTALDFLTVLLLWLPIEFGAGARLIPRPAQGYLHSVAYGIAIILGLVLFLGFRSFPGLKYNVPRHAGDYWLPLAGFAMVAPILAVVGIALGFIPFPHLPAPDVGRMARMAGLIYVATALPEEILFRALIQNLMMQRFGESARTLLAASFIFGCAHLDNGPQPLPNWRYMILAAIAGLAYGKVFQKASTVLSSAGLHMLVDWTKHFFF